MSEISRPTSQVEQCDSHVITTELPFKTAEEGSKTEAVTQNTTVAAAPKQALEPSKEVLTVSPDTSAASPLDLSNAVRANPPPPKAVSAPCTPPQSFLTSNRGRVVSLDRGQALRRVVSLDRGRELLAEMDGMNSSLAADSYSNEEEDSLGSDSSNDESSYFVEHLPSPKSKRFSFSDTASTSSAPARAGPYARIYNVDMESDASLSFSDDDDDDHGHIRPGINIVTSRAPKLPPPLPGDSSYELPPYSQGIIRLHSMGSLVSSDDDDGGNLGKREKTNPLPRRGSNESLTSSDGDTTSIDSCVRDELRDLAAPTTRRSASTGSSPQTSGRMSPVLGAHYSGFFGEYAQTPLSVPHASPPPICRGQPQLSAREFAHPQPMTSEEMGALHAGVNMMQFPPFMPPPFFPPTLYGATATMANPHNRQPHYTHRSSSGTNSSYTAGNQTLPMAYSEDDETDDGNLVHKAAREGRAPFYQGSGGAPLKNTVGDGLGSGLGGNVTENYDLLGMGMYGLQRSAQPNMRSEPYDLACGDGDGDDDRGVSSFEKGFSVYWQRWLMLTYMSVLNLLSDWTCYSVAPISLLTSEAFGKINPEQLVVVFLAANAVATACEPIILSRLGLRRTVVFGSFLLMLGSIVKSGGLPPLVEPTLTKGQGEWRVYVGFFIVGLSQPLYQCTPALLSASWFPERERTMATGVALNANQLGIGFAFIFGTLLVVDSDDIVHYFGLLSTISAVTFLGCLFQFDDAPPTPPSETARVMRGTFEWKLPLMDSILKSVRSVTSLRSHNDERERSDSNHSGSRKIQSSNQRTSQQRRRSSAESGKSERSSRPSSSSSHNSASQSPRPSSRKQSDPVRQSNAGTVPAATAATGTRRRSSTARNRTATSESGLTAAPSLAPSPSPASTSRRTPQSASEIATFEQETYAASVLAPSPMMPGPVGADRLSYSRSEDESPLHTEDDCPQEPTNERPPDTHEPSAGQGFPHAMQYVNQYPGMGMPFGYQSSQWQQGFWDPQHPAYNQQQGYQQQQSYYYNPQAYYYAQMYPSFSTHESQRGSLRSEIDEGAEPTVMISTHHLDIHIRDDQVLLSARACLSRPGFIHALVAFTVSGIVINTLSTFMDYLVRLNGAGREYTGIVGGTFQLVIMISSLIMGKATDHTRAYYSVILAMLVLGAFSLAECGVSLDADRGTDLRWTLIVVAALVGPLQPVSTELGVDVAYPLSENTVLVIQQLFSNLLSAMFIPFFKVLKNVGNEAIDDSELYERPEYTFSFYLLIVLHAGATVFFATFNGRYLRYEQEEAKKAQNEAKMMFAGPTAFHPVHYHENYRPHDFYEEQDETSEHVTESQPLLF